MGLLSGRKNDSAVAAQPSHRYETRSRGGLFSSNRNAGPGTTTGTNTNTVGTNSGGGIFGRKSKNAMAMNNGTGTGAVGNRGVGSRGVGSRGVGTGGVGTTGHTGGVGGGPGMHGSANNQMYPGSSISPQSHEMGVNVL
jgi:hypothetical protein